MSSCVVGESWIRTNKFTRERRLVHSQRGQGRSEGTNRTLVSPHGLKRGLAWSPVGFVETLLANSKTCAPCLGEDQTVVWDHIVHALLLPSPCSAAHCCSAVHVPSHDSATAPDPCGPAWVRARWLREEERRAERCFAKATATIALAENIKSTASETKRRPKSFVVSVQI